MATMADTRRSQSPTINNRIECGKGSFPSPTVTEKTEFFYTVKTGAAHPRIAHTVAEVNAILARHPSAKVVKTTKTTKIVTTHQRIR